MPKPKRTVRSTWLSQKSFVVVACRPLQWRRKFRKAKNHAWDRNSQQFLGSINLALLSWSAHRKWCRFRLLIDIRTIYSTKGKEALHIVFFLAIGVSAGRYVVNNYCPLGQWRIAVACLINSVVPICSCKSIRSTTGDGYILMIRDVRVDSRYCAV